jgi:PilZ domain
MTDRFVGILRGTSVGLLRHDVAVELLNISRSGCLFESPKPIAAGTLATVTVEMDGASYSDDVRVARCLEIPGAGERHHVGVQFVALRMPSQQSLRFLAASLNTEASGVDAVAAWLESVS